MKIIRAIGISLLITIIVSGIGPTNADITTNAGGTDLVISDIWIDSATIVYGSTPWTWIHYTVKNQGNSNVTDNIIYVNFYNVTKDGSPFFVAGYMSVSGPINAGDSVNGTFAVGHDESWPAGHYTLQLIVDQANNIVEDNDNNNISPVIEFDIIENLPDLIISDIWIDSPTVVAETTPWTWIHYTIKNIGNANVTDNTIYTSFYNVTVDGNADSIGGYMITSGPLPMNTAINDSVAVATGPYWTAGHYKIYLKVDYNSTTSFIKESNEDNNISPALEFDVIKNGIDLIVESISISTDKVLYGEGATVNYTVKNRGNLDANFTSIYMTLEGSTRDGVPLTSMGYITISGPISAGASYNGSFIVGDSDLWPVGHYILKLFIDANYSIDETDEQNNYSPELVFDIVINAPDLVISALWMETYTVNYHHNTNVYFTVENIGTLDVTDPYIYINFTNSYYNNGPLPVDAGYITVYGPLPAGGALNASFIIDSSDLWEVGHYTIQLKVDYRNLINETNENNNLSPVLEFDIVNYNPDLIISNLFEEISQDNTVLIHIFVKNIGNRGYRGDVIVRLVNSFIDNKEFNGEVTWNGAINVNTEVELLFGGTVWDAGNYQLNFVVDPDNMINETNETNNAAQLSFTVYDINTDTVSSSTIFENDTSQNTTITPSFSLPGFEFISAISLVAIVISRKIYGQNK